MRAEGKVLITFFSLKERGGGGVRVLIKEGDIWEGAFIEDLR